MKTVFILLDSLKRSYLPIYNPESPAITPNISALAQRGVVFDAHFCGSTPCMPARRDLMTGRLGFLERPWGGIEPYDETLPKLLAEKNVFSHLETDHIHYTGCGGENYLSSFTSWNLHRGAESDTVSLMPDRTGIPHPSCPPGYVGLYKYSYECTKRGYAGQKERYSTPRTLTAAADWLEQNHDADNFLLWAEGFDPHEPFDVPDEYLERYGAAPNGCPGDLYWPEYKDNNYDDAAVARLRTRYMALLTMTDEYVGRILAVLDRYDMWKDTLVILTTDHGFMLGEHGYFAKNNVPDYNEVLNIPFIAAAPGVAPGRCGALTQNIDVLPTVVEWFGAGDVRRRNAIHGKSLWPLLKREQASIRDAVITGTFGKSVCVTDGRYEYVRAPIDPAANAPLNIYCGMPALLHQFIGYDTMSDEDIAGIGFGRLSWTNYPVYRIPAASVNWKNLSLNSKRINARAGGNRLYDLKTDAAQEHPLSDAAIEARMIELLKRMMALHDSPPEQYQRLGI